MLRELPTQSGAPDGLMSIPAQDNPENYTGRYNPPSFTKSPVLLKSPYPSLPNGDPNWNYWKGTAGIQEIPLNGNGLPADEKSKPDKAILALYKGTDAGLNGHAKSNHGLALLDPTDGQTVLYKHPEPVLKLPVEDQERYPHGIEDVRIVSLDGEWILLVHVTNKNERDTTLFAHKKQRLKGVYPYAFTTGDPTNPALYEPIGMIGPDFYLKNPILHPELVQRAGTYFAMLFYRDYPNIQASLLSLEDIWNLAHDADFRRAFWNRELSPEVKEANTILRPIFRWEAKGHPKFPLGQISGGAPPLEVKYYDEITGKENDGWLFFYNATTGFDDAGNTLDRVIGVAMLDRYDPYKVIHRGPLPIIKPTSPREKNGRYKDITFTTGATIGKDSSTDDQLIRIYYTAGDQDLNIAKAPLENLLRWLTQFDNNGQFRLPQKIISAPKS